MRRINRKSNLNKVFFKTLLFYKNNFLISSFVSLSLIIVFSLGIASQFGNVNFNKYLAIANANEEELGEATVIELTNEEFENEILDTVNEEDEEVGIGGEDGEDKCNVLGINLHGGLVTYTGDGGGMFSDDEEVVSSDSINYYLEKANEDEKIEAIIIEVDSPGGSPVAAEEVANMIKRINKPVIGVIRGMGASAAYWAISSADEIFASKNSDIGSIGVTMSYVEENDKTKNFVQLSTGKYKDMGNPNKPLTLEEKELLMRDLKVIHENFVEDIAENRELSTTTVWGIADGSTMLGESAMKIGLIDKLGSLNDVIDYIESTLGITVEDCWQ